MQNTGAGLQTIADTIQRFQQFKEFAKSEGVGRGELSPAYAQNLVSSVNTVMKAATRGEWRSVSPTRQCNIPPRCNVRSTPTPSKFGTQKLNLNERQAAIASLAQNLGLRSKEASLLNAKAAYTEAAGRGVISVSDGTKGGRFREVPITSERQIEALREAAQVQGEARAVMPPEKDWKEWREGGLREARETVAAFAKCRGLHDLRATYAAERYEALVGHPAPCNGGTIIDREADRTARMTIANELGHGRIDVVSSYVGGR